VRKTLHLRLKIGRNIILIHIAAFSNQSLIFPERNRLIVTLSSVILNLTSTLQPTCGQAPAGSSLGLKVYKF
jgi:predicted Rossmann fold nucleotide-binding protein DprA/Smf involved in DNA uptake